MCVVTCGGGVGVGGGGGGAVGVGGGGEAQADPGCEQHMKLVLHAGYDRKWDTLRRWDKKLSV